ncbi:hypothetical protein MRX96_048556 [Rhipicephalus microplus]
MQLQVRKLTDNNMVPHLTLNLPYYLCHRGEVINGGFGCVLDGTKEADGRLTTLLSWDVNNGVCRRSWSGNKYAYETIQRAMKDDPALLVTLPNEADEQLLKKVLAGRKL